MSRRILSNFPGQITLEEYVKTLHAAMAEANYEWAKGLVRLFVKKLGNGVAYETEELEGVALYGLAKAINLISAYNFNMRVLRSRPMHNLPWHYYFYAELEGNDNSENGQRMLNTLKGVCPMMKVVGRYTSADTALSETKTEISLQTAADTERAPQLPASAEIKA